MPVKTIPIAAVLLFAAGCGPSSGNSDGGGTAEGTDSTAGPDDPNDLSWLVGRYLLPCQADSFERVSIDGCFEQLYHEVEFHPDGSMTGAQVMCGSRAPLDLVAEYRPGDAAGVAVIEPGQGFDKVYLYGHAKRAEVRRTSDCMKIEVLREQDFGPSPVIYYIRGSFDYLPPAEGCGAEIFPTEVPVCPEDADAAGD